MAQNRHRDRQLTQNQNNLMSEDPGDGSRNSNRLGATDKGKKDPVSPEEEAQRDENVLEAFGEEGAGVAANE